jgi:glutathione S-transferase
MRLFAHPTCPYAQRALLVRDLKGVSDSVLQTVMIDFDAPPADIVAIYADWTVPMIELSKGRGFDDSLHIMEFIDALPSSAASLFGAHVEERALTRFQLHKAIVLVLRPLKLALYSAFSPLSEAEQRDAAQWAWKGLDELLEKREGIFFGGSHLNAVDVCLATFLRKAEGAHALDGKMLLPDTGTPASEYLRALREHSFVSKICGETSTIAKAMAPFRGPRTDSTPGWMGYLPAPFD